MIPIIPMRTGGSVTSEQMHSFALTCAKTGAIQNAVDLLGAEASTMQLKESAVLFVSSLSGRAGVPVEICKAGESTGRVDEWMVTKQMLYSLWPDQLAGCIWSSNARALKDSSQRCS